MRSKKRLLSLLFLVMITVVWIIVLKAYLNIDEKSKIQKLVQEGDSYNDKELYVRAIPKYEEALNIYIDEETKAEIEEKLLKCYEGYGDMESYIELVEDRLERKTSTEEEVMIASNFEINSYQISEALALLKKGIVLFPDSKHLENIYESHEFDHKTIKTTWSEMIPTIDGNDMPAYDGQNWVYTDGNGYLINNLIFDKATPYDIDAENNKLSVVRIGEEFFVITTDGSWYGRDDGKLEDVAYISNGRVVAKKDGKYGYYNYDFELLSENHQYDWISRSSCGVVAVKDGNIWKLIKYDGSSVSDETYEDVALNSVGEAFEENVAMVKKNGSWRLIDNEGKYLSEESFAYARAPEGKGYIAVANESGLWGFIDSQGKSVIDYAYEDAYSFSDGVAAVKDSLSWLYINQKGKRVIADGFEEAYPFHHGVAIVSLADSVSLLQLAYQER